MTKLNIHEAKTHLSRYLEEVQEGKTVLICKNGNPIAELKPIKSRKKLKGSIFGMGKHLGKLNDKFFEPLTENDFPGIGL